MGCHAGTRGESFVSALRPAVGELDGPEHLSAASTHGQRFPGAFLTRSDCYAGGRRSDTPIRAGVDRAARGVRGESHQPPLQTDDGPDRPVHARPARDNCRAPLAPRSSARRRSSSRSAGNMPTEPYPTPRAHEPQQRSYIRQIAGRRQQSRARWPFRDWRVGRRPLISRGRGRAVASASRSERPPRVRRNARSSSEALAAWARLRRVLFAHGDSRTAPARPLPREVPYRFGQIDGSARRRSGDVLGRCPARVAPSPP
jgi:hypothetical protein